MIALFSVVCQEIDAYVARAKDQSCTALIGLVSRGFAFLTNLIVNTATKVHIAHTRWLCWIHRISFAWEIFFCIRCSANALLWLFRKCNSAQNHLVGIAAMFRAYFS